MSRFAGQDTYDYIIKAYWAPVPAPTPAPPPLPPPISYPDFHALAAAAVAKHCPRANLVTDSAAGRMLMWLEHNGCKVTKSIRADFCDLPLMLEQACVELRNAVAEEELA